MFETIHGVIFGICILMFILIVGVNIFIFGYILKRKKLNDRQNIERASRITEVDYTEIIASGNRIDGFISNGSGSVHSHPSTKFLVVYKNGNREIVNTADGSELCNLYLQLLKKE